jgi:hypothetical protein|tara:strand:+ start:636 stop:782 length:147 start_codon:yes stop_codon:yes gene_type:complete
MIAYSAEAGKEEKFLSTKPCEKLCKDRLGTFIALMFFSIRTERDTKKW